MEMMVPATNVDPTKIAVQLEFAQKPVCRQQKTILGDTVHPAHYLYRRSATSTGAALYPPHAQAWHEACADLCKAGNRGTPAGCSPPVPTGMHPCSQLQDVCDMPEMLSARRLTC